MTEIKPVTMFPCPVTGKLFKTKNAAMKSGVKEQKILDDDAETRRVAEISHKQQIANADFIRLNLKSVGDLKRMLIDKAKEFYGITITELSIRISFGQVSNSHGCPMDGVENWCNTHKDRPTSYLGWTGQIVVKANKPGAGKSISDSIHNTLFNRYGGKGFRGFHTGSGCGGEYNSYPMDIGFYFFLSDFPLLAAEYEKFQVESQKHLRNENLIEVAVQEAEKFASQHESVTTLQQQAAELFQQASNKRDALYASYRTSHPVTLEQLSPEWETLKNQFYNQWERYR